jgi:hypothetical protein
LGDDRAVLREALEGVTAGRLIPYLGPGLLALGPTAVPASPEALSGAIEARVRVPKRAAGNVWRAAQYVETRRFRATLEAIITDAFAAGVPGNPLHTWLAATAPPLVVDTWYDAGLLDAFAGRGLSWGWVQGWSRHRGWDETWYRAFGADGVQRTDGPDPAWRTLVYKPHGLAREGASFLLSDSDYVEVLTEIDIQTPIPEEVKRRRADRGFLFLGCRFDDQLLRTFARQIIKRSAGPRLAVLPGSLTRMEARFLAEQDIRRLDLDLTEIQDALSVPV